MGSGKTSKLILMAIGGSRTALVAWPSRGLGRVIQNDAQLEAACRRWPAVAGELRLAWLQLRAPAVAA